LSALQRADELKMPIGKMADVDALRTLLATMPTEMYHQLVYLQPLSQSPKATELCIEQARQNGWRVSVQAHKFMGMR
jgi:7-carboxy-7-deazaguanine synthase